MAQPQKSQDDLALNIYSTFGLWKGIKTPTINEEVEEFEIQVSIANYKASEPIIKTERLFKHILRAFRRNLKHAFDNYLEMKQKKKYKRGLNILEVVPYFFQEYCTEK